MNPKKFSEAMGEVKDGYYEEAANYQPRHKKNSWIKWGAMAACLVTMVCAGARLLPQGSPGSTPSPPPISSGNPSDLPMLTISEDTSGGMGFEGYMAYDISELVSANPWREDLEITTLPVYRNPVTYHEYHVAAGADFDAMRSFLLEVCGRLGLDTDALTITDDVPDEETKREITEKMQMGGGTVPEGYFDPTKLMVKTDGLEIEVDQSMTAKISFAPAVSLPEEYHFTHYASYEDLSAVAEYLKTEYKDLIGIDDPRTNIRGGDYNIDLEQGYQIEFFDAGGSVTQQILHYNFDPVAFYCDDEGKLFLARIFGPDLSQKIGDYPIITPEQARELLAQGTYLTTVPCEMPGMEYVKKVELIYRTGEHEPCYMPYYRFYVELPDMEREGLKTYGAYYVPAVSGEYILNLPTWDGSFN